MAQKDIDEVTGTETTGHEWDGIRELNTPLPKWWLYVFYATILFAAVYMVLYPAVPSLSGYTPGLLNYSTREQLVRDLADVRQARSTWLDRFEASTVTDIEQDPELLRYAMAGGHVIYADNCGPCHGAGGAGRPGYPVLADDVWLWGGSLDAIHQTLLYGIRSGNEQGRFSVMPAFGTDGILQRDEIRAVADHVLMLAGQGDANDEGARIFEEQCAACHSSDGTGNAELGAPNLTTGIWLYGGSRQEIIAQISNPRHGVMPPWIDRLGDAEIKQLTIYVHSLGGGQ
jgi:cytochrome c oxidase cbb3-type subunit III